MRRLAWDGMLHTNGTGRHEAVVRDRYGVEHRLVVIEMRGIVRGRRGARAGMRYHVQIDDIPHDFSFPALAAARARLREAAQLMVDTGRW